LIAGTHCDVGHDERARLVPVKTFLTAAADRNVCRNGSSAGNEPGHAYLGFAWRQVRSSCACLRFSAASALLDTWPYAPEQGDAFATKKMTANQRHNANFTQI
jgi:hypothetical protein